MALVLALLGSQATAAQSAQTSVTLQQFSSAKSQVLNKNQRLQISTLLTKAEFRTAVQLNCVGLYSAEKGISGQTLARERAAAACNHAKKIKPGVRVSLKLERVSRPSMHGRVSLAFILPTASPPVLASKPATKVSVKYWGAPSVYDLRTQKSLSFDLTLQTNGLVDNPRVSAVFYEPYSSWEVPAQMISIEASVSPIATGGAEKTYRVNLTIDSRQALGKWRWNISPISYSGRDVGFVYLDTNQSDFEFRRDVFGSQSVNLVPAGAPFNYESFKGQKFQLYPWEGRNVALLTKTNSLSPAVMGRILFTLDRAYDTYKSISQFSPTRHKTFNNKISIAALSYDEVGCGAACGFLGSTGIELSQPLFNRLYNGVERFDQYDQALFYELGRNFWDYAGFQRVLTAGGRGSWSSDPFWDVSATGFACYMRAITAEVNGIPMQPWDGDNSSWNSFLSETKSLAYIQQASSVFNFSNTFQAKKPPYSGKLGATDFWASIMFFFSEGKDAETFNRTFFYSLKNQRVPASTAGVVDNFVKALSAAAGNDVSDVFYNKLNFRDARQLP